MFLVLLRLHTFATLCGAVADLASGVPTPSKISGGAAAAPTMSAVAFSFMCDVRHNVHTAVGTGVRVPGIILSGLAAFACLDDLKTIVGKDVFHERFPMIEEFISSCMTELVQLLGACVSSDQDYLSRPSLFANYQHLLLDESQQIQVEINIIPRFFSDCIFFEMDVWNMRIAERKVAAAMESFFIFGGSG